MKRKLGKVKEVFIPEDYINGELIDIMDSNKIGFKVLIDNEEMEIVQEQNDENAKIMKNDLVIISEEIIEDKKNIEIELYDGE